MLMRVRSVVYPVSGHNVFVNQGQYIFIGRFLHKDSLHLNRLLFCYLFYVVFAFLFAGEDFQVKWNHYVLSFCGKKT